MAITFKFYHDSALTEEITVANPLSAVQDDVGSLAPTDYQIYFGSTASGTSVQATSNPGVDPIEVSLLDSDVGTGEVVEAVKLSTTLLGLDAAVAGDPLEIGTTVSSGVGNAYAIWVRIDPTQGNVGTYTDISIVTNGLTES